MTWGRSKIERRDLFDDGLDENLFYDDDEEDFFDLDVDERRDLLSWCRFSASALDEVDGDGDLSGDESTSIGSNFSTSCGAWTGT